MWVSNSKYWAAKEKKFKDFPDILQLFTWDIIGEKITYDWADFQYRSDLDDIYELYSLELIKCLSLPLLVSVVHSKKFVGSAKLSK